MFWNFWRIGPFWKACKNQLESTWNSSAMQNRLFLVCIESRTCWIELTKGRYQCVKVFQLNHAFWVKIKCVRLNVVNHQAGKVLMHLMLFSTILVEPGCDAEITKTGDVSIQVRYHIYPCTLISRKLTHLFLHVRVYYIFATRIYV